MTPQGHITLATGGARWFSESTFFTGSSEVCCVLVRVLSGYSEDLPDYHVYGLFDINFV